MSTLRSARMQQAKNELKNNSSKQWTQTSDVWHALLFLVDPKAIVTDDAYNSYNTILRNPINVCFVALGLWTSLGLFGPAGSCGAVLGIYFIWETVFLENLVLYKQSSQHIVVLSSCQSKPAWL